MVDEKGMYEYEGWHGVCYVVGVDL
jgi:hypothetical protein